MRKALIGGVMVLALVAAGLFLLSPDRNVQSAVIKVDGMTCADCADKVEGALTKLEGVKNAKVSLEDKVVRVQYVAAATDVALMEKAIAKLGYSAGSTKAAAPHDESSTHAGCGTTGAGAGDCCAKKATQPST